MNDDLRGISLRDIEEFKKNKVWRVITSTLKERLSLTRDDLEKAPKDNVEGMTESGEFVKVRGVVHLQGAAEEIRYLLRIVELIEDEIKEANDAN